MEHSVDVISKRKNEVYYDYMLREDKLNDEQEIKRPKPVKKVKKSFGSQEIRLKDLSFAPDGWEGVFYTGYFILIPYIVGNLFLFFVITGGVFENYKLLDTSAFFIIWAIGYEIVASITLTWIFISFLKYDTKE